jgi:hypothetical protein
MTRIRVQALKALALLGVLALINSVLPSARAASPSASRECAMPGGGCATGLLASALDPLCENDPGHHPDYDDDYNWTETDAAYPCVGEFGNLQLDIVCALQHRDKYRARLEEADLVYRQWVCACYSEVPPLSPGQLAQCLADADAEYAILRTANKLTYLIEAAECCVVPQRPAGPKVPDFLKTMVPISNN